MGAPSDHPPPHPAPPRPWYAGGLRFGCTGSGHCCRNQGGYAYVYVQEPEIEALAAHLALAPREFRDRYCQEDDGWTILRMDDPDCPFLVEGRACGVYPARPVQCRTWPFWADNLRRAADWRSAAERCPGIGQGRLYPAEEIQRIAATDEAWQLRGVFDRGVPSTDDGPVAGAREPGPGPRG